MKIKLQHGSQEVVESVENGANYFSNKAKKVKNVGEVVNNIKKEGAGFGSDTNIVSIISRDETDDLEIMSKAELAREILDRAKKLMS